MAGPLLAQWVGGGPDSMLGNLFLAFVEQYVKNATKGKDVNSE